MNDNIMVSVKIDNEQIIGSYNLILQTGIAYFMAADKFEEMGNFITANIYREIGSKIADVLKEAREHDKN